MSSQYNTPDGTRSVAQRLMSVHWPVLMVISVIASIGMASLYSVANGSFSPWAERHAFRFVVGLAMVLGIAVVSLRFWMALAYPVYLLALGLLALVPIVGSIGAEDSVINSVTSLGARRWLSAGGLQFQPSELMKVALVLMLARYYQWLPGNLVSRPKWVALPLLAILAPVVLTLKQPDLGTAVLFAVVGLALMFLAGVSSLYFAGGALGIGLAAPLIWARMHDYQRRRIEIFLDPDKDPLGAGYHITQSKIALGSGGLSGKGYMQGTQSQLNFLPEKHTDFIFTMFGEEWGFIGVVWLLVLYGLLLMLILSMSFSCRNQFGRLLIAGAALVIFIYAFINMAMVTGLVPVVGVPLPLVSYGGTSMTTIMFGLGLAMCGFVHRNMSIRRQDLGAV
jgi:rod shape determining protein RodA